jgi:hypothetical protein
MAQVLVCVVDIYTTVCAWSGFVKTAGAGENLVHSWVSGAGSSEVKE